MSADGDRIESMPEFKFPWTMPFEERFRRSYTVPVAGGCWIWARPIFSHGYGEIWINGRKESSHRASWVLHYGEIPDGLWVLHTCDVGACVNPRHLFLGTPADNSADMTKKNRQAYGEKNAQAKLTPDDVFSIRKLLKSGAKQRDIAAQFSISQGNVGHIARGRAWTHL